MQAKKIKTLDPISRQKTIRFKCKSGFKVQKSPDNDKLATCVPMTGAEKLAKKQAIKKAVQTKKSDPMIKKQAIKKQLKTLKLKKSLGI
jgi:hypothetical protein